MGQYKLIKKWLTGVQVWSKPLKDEQYVVLASELEAKLAEGFEVYADDTLVFNNLVKGDPKFEKYVALAIGKQPIKKETREEAALEFVKKFSSKEWNNAGIDALKHLAEEILEMK